MTIGKKLMLCAAAMFVAVAVLAVSSLYSIASLKAELHQAATDTGEKLIVGGELKAQVNALRMQQRRYLFYAFAQDDQNVKKSGQDFVKSFDKVRDLIAEFKKSAAGDGMVSAIDSIDSTLGQFLGNFEELERRCSSGRVKEAFPIVEAGVGIELQQKADNFMHLQKQYLETTVAAGDAKAHNMRMLAVLIGFAGILGVLAVAVVVSGVNRALDRVTTELSTGAGQIASATAQIASSSQTMASSASQHAASLEESSASSGQVRAMTRQNAENSQLAAQLMTNVDSSVRDGNQTLGAMVASMHNISASSGKISRIIKVVDEIAFQTNILALNAAVEAARAGEAGMGFAVVADEVRNLAQRSAQAAKDTTALIEESISQTKDGGTNLEAVTAVMSAITESANKVKGLIDEVSGHSRQQTAGMDQISKALTEMGSLTQSTAASAEEGAAASEELSSQARLLNEIVGRLRTMVHG